MATDEDFLGPVRMPFFNNAESVYINGQEVQSIVVKDTGGILFQKSNDIDAPLEFTFSGATLTQSEYGSFNGTNMTIDYGDGTIESTTGTFGHTYSENGTYQVKIYGVTSLGLACFDSCTGLTAMRILSSVTSLGESCFENCASLTSIIISDSVTSLGVNCFAGCTGLTSIVIPNSVTHLGQGCFSDCTGLTLITLPNSITYLGDYCFYGCTGLTSIEIPSSVTGLGGYCFYGCTGLTSIEIPSSVTGLGESCFEDCTNLNDYYLNWTSSSTIIEYDSNKMPNNTNTIFHVPEGTEQLYVNKGYPIDKIYKNPLEFTFSGTTLTQNSNGDFDGTNMMIDYGDGTVESTTGTFGHTYSENGTYQVKIYGVTSLGPLCFQNCSGLISITIPNSITSFGNSCFSSCTGLTSITIPDSVLSLGGACFYNCSGLTSIVIPNSVTSLGFGCFYGCTGLTSIVISNGVTSLADSCFNRCFGLTSITIPDGVTSLGTFCFSDCTGLTSIIIPDGVTSIGNNCFYGCSSLNDYYLNWTSASTIIVYDSNKMPYNTNTIFHIPYGTTQLYIDKGYPSNKLEEEIPFNNIVLSTDKSALSSYHNDSCTLTAQLMHDSTPINLAGVTVTFSVEDGLKERYELDTVQTNASGVATMTYSVTSVEYVDIIDDIIATAEGFDSNICEIENCFYALNQQYDITRNGTTVITKLNNDIITDLPSSYTIEFDMKSSNNPISNAEQRIYWAPNDLWTGTGQPSLAAFVGYCYSSRLEAGRRLNAQTSETNSKIVTPNEWSHIRISKDETQLYWFFYNKDKTEYSSWSIHEGDNYTDWIFGIILWSDTTFSIKNLKIKSTSVHVIKPDDDLEGAHIIP